MVVVILPTCPVVLSKEATIGIAVGATLGGLLLIVFGAIATIKIYQMRNRRLVQFRKSEINMSQKETTYKF